MVPPVTPIKPFAARIPNAEALGLESEPCQIVGIVQVEDDTCVTPQFLWLAIVTDGDETFPYALETVVPKPHSRAAKGGAWLSYT